LPRAFIRQTIDLGGESQKVEPGTSQFAGSQTANRLVITVGKVAVPDIFDTNRYAHDPRNDFVNWALVDTATFDYAADAWGYTYGATAEWYQGKWAVRGGLFDLSIVPNSPISIRHSAKSSGSAKSSDATICGDIRARSPSPVSSPGDVSEALRTRSHWLRSPAAWPISPPSANIKVAAA
jgi:hypothetical protein